MWFRVIVIFLSRQRKSGNEIESSTEVRLKEATNIHRCNFAKQTETLKVRLLFSSPIQRISSLCQPPKRGNTRMLEDYGTQGHPTTQSAYRIQSRYILEAQ